MIALPPWGRFGRVTCINWHNWRELNDFLTSNEYRVFILDGAEVTDQASFFAKVCEQLPQDPELGGYPKWDALVDSVWGGLATLQEERIALVWTHTDRMLEHGLPVLLQAISCFEQLADQLKSRETDEGCSHPAVLQVFLIGGDDNFPMLTLPE